MTLHRPLCPEGRAALGPEAEALCAEKARPFVLAATILASSMAFIDQTVVTIALPTIQDGLGASFAQLQWVANAYTLMLGALILVGGGLGDRLGRRRIFSIGIGVFALASLLCAMAPTAPLLILARGLQGIGAALLVPQSLAIIAASFPKATRGAAIGTWAAAAAITTSLGPPIGGFLVDGLSWRAAFWINLPLSLAALWLTLRYVPESRAGRSEGALDWKGALLAMLSLAALTWAMTGLAEAGRDAMVLIAAAVVGLALIVLFVRVERQVANPVIPPSLFASPAFTGANVLTLFLYAALSGVLFLLPFELIERRGMSATQVGLTLLPLGLIIGVLSRLAGRLSDHYGPRPFLLAGPCIVTVAAVLFALGFPGYWSGVMLPVVLLALGMACVVTPLTTTVMNAVSEERSGAASGVNNTASRLAGLFAVAIMGAIANLVFTLQTATDGTRFGELPPRADPLRAPLEAAFVDAYTAAMVTAAIAAALAVMTAMVLIARRSETAVELSR